MLNGPVVVAETTQFSDPPIVLGEAAYGDVLLPRVLGQSPYVQARIKAISIVSAENVGWELWFFNKQTTAAEATPDASSFIGFWSFLQSDAVRIAGAGLYYYYVDGLDIPYQALDADASLRSALHTAVIARQLAKADNSTVLLRIWLEQTQG